MFAPNNKLFVYTSGPVDDTILKYIDFTERYPPTELMTNKDMVKAIENNSQGKDGLYF
jgi:hypothetical protein